MMIMINTKKGSSMRNKHYLIWAILGALMMFAGSCTNTKVFTDSGIPKARFQVGGGWNISYKAPSDGTLYWVEEKTRKFLETRAVKKGQEVEFGGTAPEPEQVEAVLGIPMKEANMKLYFVPEKLVQP
jgi:hypothetical protein